MKEVIFTDLEGSPVRRLSRGMQVKAPVVLRGGKEPRIQLVTPCCGVAYHVEVAYLVRYYSRGKWLWVACGRNMHGRGRTRKEGCLWNYGVAFAFADGVPVEGIWTV